MESEVCTSRRESMNGMKRGERRSELSLKRGERRSELPLKSAVSERR